MRLLSYRNLGETGGPEFSIEQVKAIAANFEIQDGPNEEGEMFTRPGRPSDKFASPFPNIQAATAANGGAYPPDMSVLVKSRISLNPPLKLSFFLTNLFKNLTTSIVLALILTSATII